MEASDGEVTRESQVREGQACHTGVSRRPSVVEVPLWLVAFRSGTERVAVANRDFLYKRKCPLQKIHFFSICRTSCMSTVAQNNQLKIIMKPKRHVLGWRVPLPLTSDPSGSPPGRFRLLSGLHCLLLPPKAQGPGMTSALSLPLLLCPRVCRQSLWK